MAKSVNDSNKGAHKKLMEEYKEFVERIAEKSSERRASTEDLVKVKDDIVNKSWVF